MWFTEAHWTTFHFFSGRLRRCADEPLALRACVRSFWDCGWKPQPRLTAIFNTSTTRKRVSQAHEQTRFLELRVAQVEQQLAAAAIRRIKQDGRSCSVRLMPLVQFGKHVAIYPVGHGQGCGCFAGQTDRSCVELDTVTTGKGPMRNQLNSDFPCEKRLTHQQA